MCTKQNLPKRSKLELLLWGIAFPGFGQLLNGKYIKGILFLLLEIIINIESNFNRIIMLSFTGETKLARDLVHYNWLMFYPCVYFFAIWDAYREGDGSDKPLMFLPFVSSAYFVTVGIIYSERFTLFGLYPGPVLLPMFFLIPGLCIGFILRAFIMRTHKTN